MEYEQEVKKLIDEITQDLSSLSTGQIDQLNLLSSGFNNGSIKFSVKPEGNQLIGTLTVPYQERGKTYLREQEITDPNEIAYILGLQKLAEADENG